MSDNLTELEIAAFMGPHIKRARIVLVVIGALYAIFGYLDYGKIAETRDMVQRLTESAPSSPQLADYSSKVTLVYTLVVFSIISGIANIGLAALAGKKAMLAFNAAAAIFVIHSGMQGYVSGGMIFTNILWIMTAIVLAFGYMAALKAERLRHARA